MSDNSLLDKIHNHILEEGNSGLSSPFIAEHFLKLSGAPALTNLMVQKALGSNPLFYKEGELWFAQKIEAPLLAKTPFLVCYPLLSDDRRTILSVSLWEVMGDEKKHLLTFANPLVDGGVEEPLGTALSFPSFREGLIAFYKEIGEKTLIFFSHYQQRLLLKSMLDCGLTLSDKAMPLSTLFRLVDVKMTKFSEGISEFAKQFVMVEQEPSNGFQSGELLADLVSWVLGKIGETGVVTIADYAALEKGKSLAAIWQKATFSVDDILALEERPGVYGYKDGDDSFIYVGKGKNVRARLLTYFRVSEESPEKLTKLRDEAVTFICHYCGSELEALIMEYRLINKYQPKLNSQINILERKGEFEPIPPSLFVLPSFEEGKYLTLWYGYPGELVMKTLSFEEIDKGAVSDEAIHSFFFAGKEEVSSAEKMIAERWLLPRLNQIDRVDIASCGSAADVVTLLKSALLAGEGNGTIYRQN